jgi:predicted negative regulator of RcsB-dependent stress response
MVMGTGFCTNVYNSMGDLLILTGDTIGAIKNYEKSLKLNPQNKNAKKIIKKIKEKAPKLQ